MNRKPILDINISLCDFRNYRWTYLELKQFARKVGIKGSVSFTGE